jgi:hypothetical protein
VPWREPPLARSGRRLRSSSPPRSRLRRYRGFGCDRLRFFAGCSTTATKAKLLSKPGSALRIAGCGHCMFTGEVPSRPILLHGQSMAGREMSPEHLAAPAAFEASDIISVNRSPDRHGGSSLFVRFSPRFTEADERLMNGRDQGRVERTRFGSVERRRRLLPDGGKGSRGRDVSRKFFEEDFLAVSRGRSGGRDRASHHDSLPHLIETTAFPLASHSRHRSRGAKSTMRSFGPSPSEGRGRVDQPVMPARRALSGFQHAHRHGTRLVCRERT